MVELGVLTPTVFVFRGRRIVCITTSPYTTEDILCSEVVQYIVSLFGK
jgi:hypothetical protein